jgi:hypothetical protein
MTGFVWFFLLVTAQSSTIDIQPSGPFAVGRVIYHWVDPTRTEGLSKVPNTRREIMVDVWYPAAPAKSAQAAPYLPDAARIEKSAFAQAEKDNWRRLWPMIAGGSIRTHTYANAPVAPGQARFPLIIFSHAFSGEPYAYTHQSHGYVVATIHHTYEAPVTVFPGGRMVPLSEENARHLLVDNEEDALPWGRARIDVWAADIRFTLDQILRLNSAGDKQAPFAGRLEPGKIGVVGHSFGGMAAARVCGLDQRFKACLNQDGGLGQPILRYPDGHMPAHPFMFMHSPFPPPPTDEDLKTMRMTREEFEKDKAEAEAERDKEFEECSGGSYYVGMELPGFRHTSFTDILLLRAAGNPQEMAKALESLRTIESYTSAFFDKFLKGVPDTLLDHEPKKGSGVEIKRYGKLL